MTGFKSGASDDDPLGGEHDDDSTIDDGDSATDRDNSAVDGDQSADDGQSVGNSQVDNSALGGDATASGGGGTEDLDLPVDGRRGTDDSVDHEKTDSNLVDTNGPADTDPDGAPGGVGVGNSVPTPTDGRLPWLFTRDSITDGRERTVQLHLQTATVDRQRRVRSVLEDRLGDRVSKADLREAALLVGLADPDGVAAVLETWGYGVE